MWPEDSLVVVVLVGKKRLTEVMFYLKNYSLLNSNSHPSISITCKVSSKDDEVTNGLALTYFHSSVELRSYPLLYPNK